MSTFDDVVLTSRRAGMSGAALVRFVFTGFASSRTRWVELVPGVWLPRARVNRWALLTGMGRDWFDRAMKLPELTATIAGGEYRDGDTLRATVGKSLPFLQVRS